MAKFSISRIPYYIAVAVFMGLTALVSFWNNATATGVESDIYLGAMIFSGLLGLASLFYIATAKSGDNDEVGVEVAGVPVGKKYYYFGVLAVAAWRIVAGYQINHMETGIHSTYGVMWLVAGLGIALFTYANYRSFIAKS